MSWTPPDHTPFQWSDAPSTGTPLDAANLIASEQDLINYTKTATQSLANTVAASYVSAGPTGPLAWTANTTFKANTLISYSGTIYIVNNTYLSGATFGAIDNANITSLGVPTSAQGAANGVATLDGTTHLTAAQIPTTVQVASKLGTAGWAPRVDRVARLDVRRFYGVVRRNFANGGTAGFSNLSNSFNTDGSGNLIATTAGTAAQGDILLPATLVGSTPFAFCARVYLDATDSANSLTINLTSTADTNYGAAFALSGSSIAFNPGGLGSHRLLATPPTGFYDLFAISDGSQVGVGYSTSTAAAIGAVNNGLGSAGAINFDSVPYNTLRYDGVNPIWANVNTVRVTNASIKHKLCGVWCNVNGIAAPDAVTFGQRALLPVLSPTDYSELLRLPAGYDGKSPLDLFLVGHPSQSAETVPSGISDAGGGATQAALLDAGYALAYVRGDTASYTSANASPWGAPGGLATRKKFLDYLLTNLPQLRNIYWLGQSMGCIDGLNFHASYPGTIRALVGISGVCNLSYSYNSEGFASIINTGYGVSSLASIASYDPCLRPDVFTDLPILLFHGTSDTTIHKANHPDVFVPLVNAAGGSATEVAITGGGHLDATMMNGVYAQISTITSFLGTNV